MSAATPTTPIPSKSLPIATRPKWPIIVGGTALTLLVAGILFQIVRSEPAITGEKRSAADSQSAGKKKSPYVARVGKELITYDQVATECFQLYGGEILDNLINRMIIEQACKAQGVGVTQQEIDAEVRKIAKRAGMTVEDWYKMLQVEKHTTPLQYQRDRIWPLLALKKLAGEEVKITRKELDEWMYSNYGPRVRARAIILDNQRRAQEVWEKAIKHPEDFDRLAKEHSVDSGSRALGGQVPPIRRYAGHAALEKAAFKLRQGEVSSVIQVDRQWVILLCEGRTEPVVEDFAQVEPIAIEELREEKAQILVGKIFEEIKANTRVDNYLTQTSTGGNTSEKAGRTKIRQTGATRSPSGVKRAGGSRTSSKPRTSRRSTSTSGKRK